MWKQFQAVLKPKSRASADDDAVSDAGSTASVVSRNDEARRPKSRTTADDELAQLDAGELRRDLRTLQKKLFLAQKAVEDGNVCVEENAKLRARVDELMLASLQPALAAARGEEGTALKSAVEKLTAELSEAHESVAARDRELQVLREQNTKFKMAAVDAQRTASGDPASMMDVQHLQAELQHAREEVRGLHAKLKIEAGRVETLQKQLEDASHLERSHAKLQDETRRLKSQLSLKSAGGSAPHDSSSEDAERVESNVRLLGEGMAAAQLQWAQERQALERQLAELRQQLQGSQPQLEAEVKQDLDAMEEQVQLLTSLVTASPLSPASSHPLAVPATVAADDTAAAAKLQDMAETIRQLQEANQQLRAELQSGRRADVKLANGDTPGVAHADMHGQERRLHEVEQQLVEVKRDAAEAVQRLQVANAQLVAQLKAAQDELAVAAEAAREQAAAVASKQEDGQAPLKVQEAESQADELQELLDTLHAQEGNVAAAADAVANQKVDVEVASALAAAEQRIRLLEAELTGARAELLPLQKHVEALEAEMVRAEAGAQERICQLEADLQQARDEQAQAQGPDDAELVTAQARIMTLEAELSQARRAAQQARDEQGQTQLPDDAELVTAQARIMTLEAELSQAQEAAQQARDEQTQGPDDAELVAAQARIVTREAELSQALQAAQQARDEQAQGADDAELVTAQARIMTLEAELTQAQEAAHHARDGSAQVQVPDDAELVTAQARIMTLESELTQAQTAAQQERTTAQQRVQELEAELATAQQHSAEVATELATAQQHTQQLEVRLAGALAEAEQQVAERAAAQAAVEQAAAKQATAQQQAQQLHAELAVALSRTETSSAELATAHQRLEADLTMAQHRISGLEAELAAARASQVNSSEGSTAQQQLEADLATAQQQISALEAQLASGVPSAHANSTGDSSASQQLEADLATAQQRISELETQLAGAGGDRGTDSIDASQTQQQLAADLAAAQQLAQQLQADLEAAQQQGQRSEMELAKAHQRVQELEESSAKSHMLEAELVASQQQLHKANADLAAAQQHVLELEQSTAKVQTLEAELAASQQQAQKANADLAAAQQRFDQLGQDLYAARQISLQEMQSELTVAQAGAADRSQIEAALSATQEAQQELAAELAAAGKLVTQLEQQVDGLKAQLAASESRNAALQEELSQAERKVMEAYGGLAAATADSGASKEAVEKMMAEVDAKLKKAERSGAALQEQVAALQKQLAATEQKLAEDSSEHMIQGRKLSSAHERIVMLAESEHRLEAELAEARAELEAAQEQAAAAAAAAVEAVEAVEELRAQLTQEQYLAARYKEDCDKLRSSLQALAAKKWEMAAREKELNNRQTEAELATGSFKRLEAELALMREERDRALERYKQEANEHAVAQRMLEEIHSNRRSMQELRHHNEELTRLLNEKLDGSGLAPMLSSSGYYSRMEHLKQKLASLNIALDHANQTDVAFIRLASELMTVAREATGVADKAAAENPSRFSLDFGGGSFRSVGSAALQQHHSYGSVGTPGASVGSLRSADSFSGGSRRGGGSPGQESDAEYTGDLVELVQKLRAENQDLRDDTTALREQVKLLRQQCYEHIQQKAAAGAAQPAVSQQTAAQRQLSRSASERKAGWFTPLMGRKASNAASLDEGPHEGADTPRNAARLGSVAESSPRQGSSGGDPPSPFATVGAQHSEDAEDLIEALEAARRQLQELGAQLQAAKLQNNELQQRVDDLELAAIRGEAEHYLELDALQRDARGEPMTSESESPRAPARPSLLQRMQSTPESRLEAAIESPRHNEAVEKLRAKVESLAEALDAQRGERAQLTMERDELLAQVQELDAQNSALEERLREAVNSRAGAERERESLRASAAGAAEALDGQGERCRVLQEGNGRLAGEVETLKRYMERSEELKVRQLAEREALERQLAAVQDQAAKLEGELREVQQQLATAQAGLQAATAAREAVAAELQQVQRHAAELEDDCATLRQELQAASSRAAEADRAGKRSQELAAQLQDLESTMARCVKLTDRCSDLELENIGLKEQRDSLTRQLSMEQHESQNWAQQAQLARAGLAGGLQLRTDVGVQLSALTVQLSALVAADGQLLATAGDQVTALAAIAQSLQGLQDTGADVPEQPMPALTLDSPSNFSSFALSPAPELQVKTAAVNLPAPPGDKAPGSPGSSAWQVLVGSQNDQLAAQRGQLQAASAAAAQLRIENEQLRAAAVRAAAQHAADLSAIKAAEEDLQLQIVAAEQVLQSKQAAMGLMEAQHRTQLLAARSDEEEARAEADRLATEKSVLERKLQELEAEMNERLERLQRINRKKGSEGEELQAQLSAAAAKIAAAEATERDLRKELDAQKKEVADLRSKAAELQKKLTEAEARVAASRQELASLSQQATKLQPAAQQRDSLQQELQKQAQELAAANEKAQQLEEAEAHIEELEEVCDRLEVDCGRKDGVIANLEARLRVLDDEVASLNEALSEERRRCAATVATAAAELDALAGLPRERWPPGVRSLVEDLEVKMAGQVADRVKQEAEDLEASYEDQVLSLRQELGDAQLAQATSAFELQQAQGRIADLTAALAVTDQRIAAALAEARAEHERHVQELRQANQEAAEAADAAVAGAAAEADSWRVKYEGEREERTALRDRVRLLLEERDEELAALRRQMRGGGNVELPPGPLPPGGPSREIVPADDAELPLSTRSLPSLPSIGARPHGQGGEGDAPSGDVSSYWQRRVEELEGALELWKRAYEEAESTSALRTQAEAALKEELMRLQGVERSASVDLQYLRSVIVSGFESGELPRDSGMFTVLARLMHFSPSEVEKIKSGKGLVSKGSGGVKR